MISLVQKYLHFHRFTGPSRRTGKTSRLKKGDVDILEEETPQGPGADTGYSETEALYACHGFMTAVKATGSCSKSKSLS